jgi:1-acyl-sn-glycerol-3-phosphate acyltransferase
MLVVEIPVTRPGNSDWYYWRLVATGVCFVLFGAGGLVLSAVVFPFLLLVPGKHRAQRARWCVQKSFALFMRLMVRAGVMRWEVIGAQRLRTCSNHLILANHPTLIDVVALVALVPNASCVVKQAMWKNPLVCSVVRAAGYISNAEPERVIDACVEDLQHAQPLIIFPEGTRTVPQTPLRFQRGAAYIAMRSGKPVLPVLITCAPSTLAKGAKWYHIPRRRFTLRVEALEPIEVCDWIDGNQPASLQARRMTQALETFFTEQLSQYGNIEHAQA